MPITRAGMFRIMDSVYVNEIQKMREQTGHAYAPNDMNPFENFIQAAEEMESTKEVELWNQSYKHVVAIKMWVKADAANRALMDAREPIEKRINDEIVYLLLLRAMIEENKLDAHVAEHGEAGVQAIGPNLMTPTKPQLVKDEDGGVGGPFGLGHIDGSE
jgi:hypothetical protein